MPEDAVFREVTVERLVLREPRSGRKRAVIETVEVGFDDEDQRAYPAVCLSLLDAAGDEEIVIEVDERGEPRVTLGRGRFGLVLTDRGMSLWAEGNEVAVIDSGDGGRLTLFNAGGKTALRLP